VTSGIALGIIIFLLLLSLPYKQQMVFAAKAQPSNHQGLFINLPSSYSNQKIVLDGKDDDWKTNKKYEVKFNGILTPQMPFAHDNNNPVVGSIMIRNNESHIAIFMDLKTRLPVQDPFRKIALSFDENGDGRWTTGDTDKFIIAIGPGKPLFLENYYFSNDEGNIKRAPFADTKGFEAYLRYVSASETTLEMIIPYKGTNNFYDLQLYLGDTFSFGLIYNAGGSNPLQQTSSSINSFTYTIAQQPHNNILEGLEALCILGAGAAIPFAIVRVSSRRTDEIKHRFVSKRLTIISLSILFVSVLVIVTNPILVTSVLFYLQSLTDTIHQQGLLEIGFYALILGIIPATLSLIMFRHAKYLTSKLVFDQQLLLKLSIFFFLVMTIAVASRPLGWAILGVSAFLKIPNLDVLRYHVGVLEDFVNDVIQILLLPVFYSLMIWIPSVFLLLILYYIILNRDNNNKQLKIKLKVSLVAIGMTFFSVLALPNIIGAFIPFEQHLLDFFLLIGPTIASIISSFLTAEGYSKTMRENLNVIKGNSIGEKNGMSVIRLQQPQNVGDGANKLKTAGLKFLAVIHLGINTLGLSRNLFLLGILFSSVAFPLSYSVVNQAFANAVSNFVISDQGQSLEAARIVYTSSIMLFSFFWIYDILMLLRGFSEEYLDSENLIFIALKKHSGLLIALCFLSLMVVLSINEGLSNSREIEAQKSLPLWVQQKIGIQNNENVPLSDMASVLVFFTGLSTIAGVIYVIIRRRPKIHNLLTAKLQTD
jgi:hypothetical protein